MPGPMYGQDVPQEQQAELLGSEGFQRWPVDMKPELGDALLVSFTPGNPPFSNDSSATTADIMRIKALNRPGNS